MKTSALFSLFLALLIAVPADANTSVHSSNEPHTDIFFGPMIVLPRGMMRDDVKTMGVWELGFARQIKQTPLHLGFHMGLGSYGSYQTEMPYFDNGQWVNTRFKVNDNVRTFFTSLRYDFRQNATLVPYAQVKFGNYRMSSRYRIEDPMSDPDCPKDFENELMHADNTWIYGGSLGLRFQPLANAAESRDRFTIDLYGGFMRGNLIRYAAHNAPHGGAMVNGPVQVGDDLHIHREADWIANQYHGTNVYRSPLDTIEFGLRLGVRF